MCMSLMCFLAHSPRKSRTVVYIIRTSLRLLLCELLVGLGQVLVVGVVGGGAERGGDVRKKFMTVIERGGL